jgi:hypothetical protein
MELFNNAVLTAESTKHGLGKGHVFGQNTLAFFLLTSACLHAALIWGQKTEHEESNSVHYQKTTVQGLHLRVRGNESAALPDQALTDKPVTPTSDEKKQPLGSWVQSDQENRQPWRWQQPMMSSEYSGADQASEPVKGIPVGNSSFAGLGGSKRKAFGFINDSANNMRGGNGAEVTSSASLNHIIQSMLKQLGDDLNIQFPIDDEQICLLQNPVVCKHSNTNFERYLSQKTPVLRNLLGPTPVKVTVYEGRWQVLLTP